MIKVLYYNGETEVVKQKKLRIMGFGKFPTLWNAVRQVKEVQCRVCGEMKPWREMLFQNGGLVDNCCAECRNTIL